MHPNEYELDNSHNHYAYLGTYPYEQIHDNKHPSISASYKSRVTDSAKLVVDTKHICRYLLDVYAIKHIHR